MSRNCPEWKVSWPGCAESSMRGMFKLKEEGEEEEGEEEGEEGEEEEGVE